MPFGGNPPEATILAAVPVLARMAGAEVQLSRLYRTPFFPGGAGPDYVNAAASMTLRHDMDAQGLLTVLHKIEALFGRERMVRWGSRTLDLDLLALGDSVLPDAATQDRWRALSREDQVRRAPDRLILPHPRIQDRAFVLVPLADVAPGWVHPRSGLDVAAMLAALPEGEVAEVQPLNVPGKP